MDFKQYSELVEKTDESKKHQVSIYGLVSEVGSILSTLKKRFIVGHEYPSFNQELSEELGDTLWYLTSLAGRYKLSLDKIAINNIAKAQSFYDPGELRLFDSGYPDDEQLLRKFSILFTEKNIKGRVLVKMKLDDCFIGDPLSDNSYDPDDGYRYHDAFHLAYAAVLGWSPIIRRMLKRKRKSDQKIDEVEDGARAAIVEEAISIYIFNNAEDRDYYKDEGAINFGLLQTVKDLTGELEVNICTAKEWKKAIHLGYEMFHNLKNNRGGILNVDLDGRTITYKES